MALLLVIFGAVPPSPPADVEPRCSAQRLDFGQRFTTCLRQHNRVTKNLSDFECWDSCRNSLTGTKWEIIDCFFTCNTHRAHPVLAAAFPQAATLLWNIISKELHDCIWFSGDLSCQCSSIKSLSFKLNADLISRASLLSSLPLIFHQFCQKKKIQYFTVKWFFFPKLQ